MSVRASPLLRVSGLAKRFGGLAALEDVSLEVPRGAITAVIGPNGAGKTTLFSLISGGLKPSAGEIFLEDRPITGLRPDRVAARGLVRSFQLVRLFHRMTALENVVVGCHLHTRGELVAALVRPRWYRAQEQRVAAEAQELLAFVGLAEHAGKPAANLTYGQQRLLEIARALAAHPKMLLLDEPAAGLNPTETAVLAELIRAVRARGVTVLFIEHDVGLVMGVADEVHVLDFGRRIASGAPEAVRQDAAVLAAYLGDVVARPSATGR
jgi:branched-chain amino acid transport system ATP-binding protein